MPVFMPPISTVALTAANTAIAASRVTQNNVLLAARGRLYANNVSPPAGMFDGGDWRPHDTAPRDGTVIEIRNSYGVAPWYGIYKWVEGGWQDARDERRGCDDGSHISWRPFNGSVEAYSDPLNGAQDTLEYWDAAIIQKTGGLVNPAKIRADNKAKRKPASDPSGDGFLIGLIAIALALCLAIPVLAAIS